MPKLHDQSSVPDGGFSPIPAGQYLCRIDEVTTEKDGKPMVSKKGGYEMWKLSLRLVSGQHKNRIIWDYIVFSPAAEGRVKCLRRACGFPVNTEMDFEPDCVRGKTVMVDVLIVNNVYNDPKTGEVRQSEQNKVSFSGYAPSEGEYEQSQVPPGDMSDADPEEPPF